MSPLVELFERRDRTAVTGLERAAGIEARYQAAASARHLRWVFDAAHANGRDSNGGLQLLEPVMAVEVVTPEECLGTIIGDLNSRRGQVLSLNERGTSKVVDGYVLGLSRGRANATMHFAHSAPVPEAIGAKVQQVEDGGAVGGGSAVFS